MLYLKKKIALFKDATLYYIRWKKKKCQSFFAVFMFCTTFDSYLLKVWLENHYFQWWLHFKSRANFLIFFAVPSFINCCYLTDWTCLKSRNDKFWVQGFQFQQYPWQLVTMRNNALRYIFAIHNILY